jgi:hypothetical protein
MPAKPTIAMIDDGSGTVVVKIETSSRAML